MIHGALAQGLGRGKVRATLGLLGWSRDRELLAQGRGEKSEDNPRGREIRVEIRGTARPGHGWSCRTRREDVGFVSFSDCGGIKGWKNELPARPKPREFPWAAEALPSARLCAASLVGISRGN